MEFQTEAESKVKPPDPQFIRIHTAFTHVLYLSGVADYLDKVRADAEQLGGLSTNDKSDLGLLLVNQLAPWFGMCRYPN